MRTPRDQKRKYIKLSEDFMESLFNALEDEVPHPDFSAVGTALTEVLSHPCCPIEFRENLLLAMIRQSIAELDHQLEWPVYIVLSK